MKKHFKFSHIGLLALIAVTISCLSSPFVDTAKPRYLFPGDYMADPAARVFNGRIFIYPSHDRNSGGFGSESGSAYDMVDYHVFSLDDPLNGEVTHHGLALSLTDIPWARGQLWDNDVAHKDGRYYMYFPAKDKNKLFRIGVASADKPEGPFIPQSEPMTGSYSIDPCVFEEDGNYYMYFGGIWGGQLQYYNGNIYTDPLKRDPNEKPLGRAIAPRVAKLSSDMFQFAEDPRELIITDEKGNPLGSTDTGRRFFEASWMHNVNSRRV